MSSDLYLREIALLLTKGLLMKLSCASQSNSANAVTLLSFENDTSTSSSRSGAYSSRIVVKRENRFVDIVDTVVVRDRD